MTKFFAVFGKPIAHSKSPLMHNAGFESLKYDAIYTRYELSENQDLKSTILSLKLDGANITAPYKHEAFLACDLTHGLAKNLKLVNTIKVENDKLIGFNTDGHGFWSSLMSFEDLPKSPKTLIIGAGATAKTIFYTLKEHEILPDIINRTQEKLLTFKDENIKLLSWNDELENYDLIINSTSAGLSNELPMPEDKLGKLLKNARFAYDVNYHLSPFLLSAKAKDCQTKNGKDMLFFQGIKAFEIFTNANINRQTFLAMQEILNIAD